MNAEPSSPGAQLRRSAAHVLVDDLSAPELTERSAHHLLRVRRIGRDETLTLTDGGGSWRTARLEGDELVDLGAVVTDAPTGPTSELLVAIPKQDRPEWIVQKATELGIGRIVFLHTRRSVVRWEPERAAKHLSKLRTVAAEALAQSRRVVLPEVLGPVDSLDAFGQAPTVLAEPGGGPVTLEHGRIAVGPEGGWADDELELAVATVSLGEHVLRVETAALAACALIGAARATR